MQTVDRMVRVSVLAFVSSIAIASAGCSTSGSGSGSAASSSSSVGNARAGTATVTRVSELQANVGKQVTLVGTARYGNSPEDSRLQLRGGAVDLPVYRWPDGYVNHPVSVTGTVVDAQAAGGNVSGGTQANPGRAFRVGDVQDVQRWSR
jgi:hypothetical protein